MHKPYIRKAHYYETDQMGIVHHSNYIRWFEEARVHLMDVVGFGYRRLEEAGIASPLLGVSCDYRAMVRFDDTVAILPRIEEMTGTRMRISYRVVDSATGELRATGETRHCFLGEAGRPISVKKQMPRVHQLFAGCVGEELWESPGAQ